MFTVQAYEKIFFSTVALFFFNLLQAQELSIQLAPGLMNYGGDLQSKFYTFKQADFSISGSLMYRIDNWVFRGGITYGKVKGSDAANALYEKRNLSFESSISEISFCLQYDLFQLNEKKFTPYIFAGIGYFHFNPYASYNSQKIYLRPLSTEGEGLTIYPKRKFYQLTQLDDPIGIGFKYKVSDHILIGLEFCSRFLFTDYLDDVSDRYPDENTLLKERGQLAVNLSFRGNEIDPSLTFPSDKPRGNPKNKDNFYTSVFSLIYVFQKRSEINGGGYSHKKMRSLNCPKKVF